MWEGAIQTERMWAHDETPQFINYNSSGQSKKKIFAGTSDDCTKLSKENRESVTVQPYSNFAGELVMVQVIFSGSGLTSHMCPQSAADKIPNLLISVNESGCTRGETLLAAYQELSKIISEKRKEKGEEEEEHVVLADGHKSRFDLNVMKKCEDSFMPQFILWPDTSGATQKHDQINGNLHLKYEELKSKMYSEYSDLNRECFMNILAEIISDWATPEKLVKAGKRVGISSEGLSVEWMDQSMFERAEAILNPPTNITPTIQISSPENVRKGSAEYWKSKFVQANDQLAPKM